MKPCMFSCIRIRFRIIYIFRKEVPCGSFACTKEFLWEESGAEKVGVKAEERGKLPAVAPFRRLTNSSGPYCSSGLKNLGDTIIDSSLPFLKGKHKCTEDRTQDPRWQSWGKQRKTLVRWERWTLLRFVMQAIHLEGCLDVSWDRSLEMKNDFILPITLLSAQQSA
jgi:hypothetical protein